MGFEGLPKLPRLNPYQDGLSPYLAGEQAKVDAKHRPLIKQLSQEEALKALEREQEHMAQGNEDEEAGERFSEEEAAEILLFAKMRGLINISIQSNRRYEFRLNPQNGTIHLVELETEQVIMQLHPDELVRLSEKLHRYAGMLADQSG